MTAFLMALLLPTASAGAQWNHEVGQPVRYAIEVNALLPFVVFIRDQGKESLRVPAMGFQFITECTPKRALPKGKGWEMSCRVEDASAFVNPVTQDQGGRGQHIANQLEERVESATFTYRQHTNGQISVFNIVGPTKNEIELQHLELAGAYLELGLAAIDVPLYSKEGQTTGQWEHRPMRFAKLPVVGSTQGKIKAHQQLTSVSDHELVYTGTATGGLMYGQSSWSIDINTALVFDPKSGRAIGSEAHMRGAPSAGRIRHTTPPLSMDARLIELPPDQVVPLKPSKGT